MSDQQQTQMPQENSPGISGKAFTYSVNEDTDEVEIDLGEIVGVLLHWLWLIVVVALVCGIAGYSYSRFLLPEEFESTTKIYVLDKSESTSSTYTELQAGSQLTQDYVEIITSRTILEAVMEENGLSDVYTYKTFANKVDVTTPDDTRIISITVTDTDPALAQQLANDIRDKAAELILDTMQIDAINTYETANYPTTKSGPNNTKYALIAAFLGAVLVIAIVVIRYLLDDSVKTSEDVERYLRLSTLAMIPLDENVEGSERGRRHSKGKKKSGHARAGQQMSKEPSEVPASTGPETQYQDDQPEQVSDAAEQDVPLRQPDAQAGVGPKPAAPQNQMQQRTRQQRPAQSQQQTAPNSAGRSSQQMNRPQQTNEGNLQSSRTQARSQQAGSDERRPAASRTPSQGTENGNAAGNSRASRNGQNVRQQNSQNTGNVQRGSYSRPAQERRPKVDEAVQRTRRDVYPREQEQQYEQETYHDTYTQDFDDMAEDDFDFDDFVSGEE